MKWPGSILEDIFIGFVMKCYILKKKIIQICMNFGIYIEI